MIAYDGLMSPERGYSLQGKALLSQQSSSRSPGTTETQLESQVASRWKLECDVQDAHSLDVGTKECHDSRTGRSHSRFGSVSSRPVVVERSTLPPRSFEALRRDRH